jgi:hypothetical protein
MTPPMSQNNVVIAGKYASKRSHREIPEVLTGRKEKNKSRGVEARGT